MNFVQRMIEDTNKYSAMNYNRYPAVMVSGKGVWVKDARGRSFIDMLSAYSAVNYGHSHPRIVKAIQEQAKRLLIVSGNYYNDQQAKALKVLTEFCGKDKALFSSGGAESVETAIKISRKWGYLKRGGVENGKAEIITCEGNFHGRTTTIIGFSDTDEYKKGFDPFTPGFNKKIKFGDPDELEGAINKNTVAFLVEPIQGEGGMNVPPVGYLKEVENICRKYNILLVLDEIQTGFGRTGADFAYQHEFVNPDILIVGKSLGGGIAVSAVLADDPIMNVIGPGHHGSTFGGNPLACAVVVEAVGILKDENLSERSREMGDYLKFRLKQLKCDLIKEVRGRGLFIGVELTSGIRDIHQFCETLLEYGVMCTSARGNVLRLTPPLVIERKEIDLALEIIEKVFSDWRL